MEIPEALRGDLCGDWKSKLLKSPVTGQPKPILANALIALREAPDWTGVIAYDEFALATMAMRPPPWRKHQNNTWTPQHWTDCDDALATEWLHHCNITVPLGVTQTAVGTIAKEAAFHPIQDYLNGLKWDNTERAALFATKCLGAADTPYHRTISKCMFIAAVARVMRPGCKVDHVPILEGGQGTLKSTAIDKMFSPWFSDDLAELGTKDAAMQVRVAWGIEIAELASMTRGEIERVKAFITRKIDRFRPPFGRHVIHAPRQSVFFGSTNADTYLKDDTGGRRFWPIKCGTIDIPAIERDRDQIWAEARTLFEAGTPWWLANGRDTDLANNEQADRFVSDPWEQPIAEYLEDKDSTSVSDILSRVIDKPQERWTQLDQNRVAACLRSLGFARKRASQPPRHWRYCRSVPLSSGPNDEDWDG